LDENSKDSIERIIYNIEYLQNNFDVISENYQIDKVTFLTNLTNITTKINELENLIEKNKNLTGNTEKDLMRMYLSTEFETIKNDIKKDLKLEFTNKFDKELKKIKNTNIKFYLLLIISLSSFSISCFILIKNLY